ncbi:MAG: nucleotidyl transferase AbiEii/AbiGii toxin family protein [Verrucomicrobiota bacterium]
MEIRSIETIIRALNSEEVRYIIVGGLAVNAHGYERFTRDLDLVIGLENDNILRGLRALLGIGYVPSIPVTPEEFAEPGNREMWRRDKNMLVLKLWSDVHRRTPIDVFVYEPFDFKTEYEMAERLEIASGLVAPFVTCESLLAMKRLAARPQDLADIAALEEARKISESGTDEPS